MSKEMEALYLLEIEYSKLDYTINIDGVDVIDLLRKALTPPTEQEVCEALSDYISNGTIVYYENGKFKFDAINYKGEEKTVFITVNTVYANKNYYYVRYPLPPHLITMISKFYEGE